MSQTVKIDAAAQDAIAEIVGTPWEKDYYDNTNDDERDYTALITREGTSIRVLVSGEGYPAYMWHYEAEQIANSILRAAKDAKAFQKAETEWAGVQMQRLNCEITGAQNMWGYGFYVNGRHYEVNFTTNEKARACVILNQAAKPKRSAMDGCTCVQSTQRERLAAFISSTSLSRERSSQRYFQLSTSSNRRRITHDRYSSFSSTRDERRDAEADHRTRRSTDRQSQRTERPALFN